MYRETDFISIAAFVKPSIGLGLISVIITIIQLPVETIKHFLNQSLKIL